MTVHMIHLGKILVSSREKLVFLTAKAQKSMLEFMETGLLLKKKNKNLLIPNWILVILISNWILLMSLKLFQFSHQRLLGRHIHGGLSGSFCLLFCSASNMSEKTESFYKSTDCARTKPKYVDCQLGNMAEAWRIVICC